VVYNIALLIVRMLLPTRNRDSSVDIVTRLQVERQMNLGSIPGSGKKFLSSP
jgi:hypothetical protein